jgi:hypothetical protein
MRHDSEIPRSGATASIWTPKSQIRATDQELVARAGTNVERAN